MKHNLQKSNEKKKITPLRVILSVICGLLALILLVLVGARIYFRMPVSDYYRASEKAFRIPGLSDGFVPQGLDFDMRTDLFWVTGYMNDGSASPIYLVKKDSGELFKTVYLANEDGSVYNGHAGGVAVGWDYAYIAGGADRCIYAYSCDEIMTAADGATVAAKGNISTKASEDDSLRVSCLTIDENYLYAVEFYREPKYPTPDSHKMTTPAGDYNQALAVAYKVSYEEDAVFGVEPTPALAISLPDHVQGMCFGEDRIFLSTSYGTSFSYVYGYDLTRVSAEGTIHFLGTDMPLFYLDSYSLAEIRKLPPMAEEIVIVEGKLYTMCESASEKYLFGNLTSSRWCYATELGRMKNRAELREDLK